MSLKPFSSADFGTVSAQLDGIIPERLIHKNVSAGTSGSELDFSADRKHRVNIVDLPSKVLSMTLGGLEPNQSTRRHRHNYETLIYVLEGNGKSIIGDLEINWQRGDAFYVPVWVWHEHMNMSPTENASYLACENAPLLQNLGIALREEG